PEQTMPPAWQIVATAVTVSQYLTYNVRHTSHKEFYQRKTPFAPRQRIVFQGLNYDQIKGLDGDCFYRLFVDAGFDGSR
ncbi:MAG TPA: hypothetical protein VFR78_22665, partial [Pyrinomonadaceae bacterium]|nr:hypothetical protein [Pyrinomonadaceae bacterium]